MNLWKTPLLVISSLVVLVACAPASLQALRDRPGYSATFWTELPMDEVVSRIESRMRTCLTGRPGQAQGAIMVEREDGVVTIAHTFRDLGKIHYLRAIDVRSVEDRVRIDAIMLRPIMEQTGRLIPEWITGSTICPYDNEVDADQLGV